VSNHYFFPHVGIYAALLLFAIIFSAGCSKAAAPDVIQGSIVEIQKTTSPISISYRIPAKITVGESILVTITCLIQESADDLVLTLKADTGLEITQAAVQTRYGSRPAKASLSKTVALTAKKEGLHYLNVFVSGLFSGQRMVRAGALSVVTSGYDPKEALEDASPVTTDQQGQPLITMPAQEPADK